MNKTIEKLKEYIESGAYKYSSPMIGKEEVEYCIEALEKRTEGWISIKDRLPSKPDIGVDGYIVQKKNVYEPFSAYWDGYKWTDDYNEIQDGIIAWMYLPKPYIQIEE